MNLALRDACSPAEAEVALEACARKLRRRWLDAASSATNRSYRSPLASQTMRTATGPSINFAYERELRPIDLENRCRAFFGPIPHGWSEDYAVFSSGQAAMAAALHLLETFEFLGAKRPLSAAHCGAYFETTEVLSLFPSLLHVLAKGRDILTHIWTIAPEILLIEPTFYDGKFANVDLMELTRKLSLAQGKVKVVLFDDTLTGVANNLADDFSALQALSPVVVIRVSSGLKLFQGGLELANVGVMSVYTPSAGQLRARDTGKALRRIRSLLGLGLGFSEMAALEVPWFLNRDHTNRYQAAVFANNALLANALADSKSAVAFVAHPILDCSRGVAPFCILSLKDTSQQAYERLRRWIVTEARRRQILFEQGGSFGFRGHRFEVVQPDNGTAPFLRVAVGRRLGWSLDGIVSLLRNIS
jgi:hypothetical protein